MSEVRRKSLFLISLTFLLLTQIGKDLKRQSNISNNFFQSFNPSIFQSFNKEDRRQKSEVRRKIFVLDSFNSKKQSNKIFQSFNPSIF